MLLSWVAASVFISHSPVGPAWPGGSEHVPGDGRVGPAPEQLPSSVGEAPPPRRHANPGGGIQQAEDGHRAEYLRLRQRLGLLQRGPWNGGEQVQGDGDHPQLRQVQGHVDAVLPGLPHAQDTAGAHLQPGGLGPANVLQLVLIGVGGADVGKIPAGRLQIGVVPGHPGLPHGLELLDALEPVGGAQGKAGLRPQTAVGLQGVVQLPAVEAPARCHNGIAVNSGGLIVLALGHDLLDGEKGVLLRPGVVVAGLGAEPAVLAAFAAAAVDDGAQLPPVPAQGPAYLIRRPAQFLQVCLHQHAQVVPPPQARPADDLFRQ